jgi:hypothetical protein
MMMVSTGMQESKEQTNSPGGERGDGMDQAHGHDHD